MPKSAQIHAWLPLAILLAALASALALGGDRSYFYRHTGLHSQMTVKNLAVAVNMSPKHYFRLATKITRNEDGGFAYDSYARFPIGGYALIKLATLPFGDSLSAKLLAARFLMLAMFCGVPPLAITAVVRWRLRGA